MPGAPGAIRQRLDLDAKLGTEIGDGILALEVDVIDDSELPGPFFERRPLGQKAPEKRRALGIADEHLAAAHDVDDLVIETVRPRQLGLQRANWSPGRVRQRRRDHGRWNGRGSDSGCRGSNSQPPLFQRMRGWRHARWTLLGRSGSGQCAEHHDDETSGA